MAQALTYIAICLFAYALVEKRLSTTPITGPIVFVALGMLASSQALGLIEREALLSHLLESNPH